MQVQGAQACQSLVAGRHSKNFVLVKNVYTGSVPRRMRELKGCEVNDIPHMRGICQGRSIFVRFGLSPPIDHEEEGEQDRPLLIGGPMKLQIWG